MLAFPLDPALLGSLTPHREVSMKAVIAASLPNEFAAEFTNLIRRFDELHAGCTIQIIADAALPQDLRPIFERLGFPVVDPRTFGFDRDSD